MPSDAPLWEPNDYWADTTLAYILTVYLVAFVCLISGFVLLHVHSPCECSYPFTPPNSLYADDLGSVDDCIVRPPFGWRQLLRPSFGGVCFLFSLSISSFASSLVAIVFKNQSSVGWRIVWSCTLVANGLASCSLLLIGEGVRYFDRRPTTLNHSGSHDDGMAGNVPTTPDSHNHNNENENIHNKRQRVRKCEWRSTFIWIALVIAAIHTIFQLAMPSMAVAALLYGLATTWVIGCIIWRMYRDGRAVLRRVLCGWASLFAMGQVIVLTAVATRIALAPSCSHYLASRYYSCPLPDTFNHNAGTPFHHLIMLWSTLPRY
jgi:hypothetical protein